MFTKCKGQNRECQAQGRNLDSQLLQQVNKKSLTLYHIGKHQYCQIADTKLDLFELPWYYSRQKHGKWHKVFLSCSSESLKVTNMLRVFCQLNQAFPLRGQYIPCPKPSLFLHIAALGIGFYELILIKVPKADAIYLVLSKCSVSQQGFIYLIQKNMVLRQNSSHEWQARRGMVRPRSGFLDLFK